MNSTPPKAKNNPPGMNSNLLDSLHSPITAWQGESIAPAWYESLMQTQCARCRHSLFVQLPVQLVFFASLSQEDWS